MEQLNNYAVPTPNIILKYNIRRCSMYATRLKKVGGSIMLAVPRFAKNAKSGAG